MSYGFIGSGNMAQAIISGSIKSGKIQPGALNIFDINENLVKQLAKSMSVSSFSDVSALVKASKTVFLAVKPSVLPSLLPSISKDIASCTPLVVSMAAGCSLEYLSSFLPEKTPIIRIMPNLNVAVGAGVTALVSNSFVSDAQKKSLIDFLECSGMVTEIDEKDFDTFMAIAGCSPAFTYLYIDSLAKGAHKNGMSKKKALEIASQAVLGSAKMMLSADEHPWSLIDKVCSPGGATIKGVCTLEDNNFQSTVVKAVESTFK